MKNFYKAALRTATLLVCCEVASGMPQQVTELKIDPLLLVSLKECRNIMTNLGNEIYPGWDFQKTPILFYRPNVQEVLINFPHKPHGFSEYTGFNPLGHETIYVRDDSTLIALDDQNTTREIDGIAVLVVADPFSSMRNQLRDVLTARSKEWAVNWLKDWNFIPSPYGRIQLILHEAFHVYQNKMAPDKSANEMVTAQYPLLDPENNALYVLEGNILKDALLADNSQNRLEKIKEFVAVRAFRQSRLDSSNVEYEDLNEYSEGLAKYVEYKFLLHGKAIKPIAEMSFQQGFHGYGDVLTLHFQECMRNMVNIVAVNDDRFGNKFGSGPLRFKLYELGACQALLLDEIMPSWKEKIFGEAVYLSDLLHQALALSTAELERYLEQAKREYRYEEAYQDKLQFERDGKEKIQEKLDAILKTSNTLVKICYEGYVQKIGLAFTPFGVTQITKESAIYDLTPIKARFKEGVELQMKQVLPVLIDRDQKMIVFAISTPANNIGPDTTGQIETEYFKLSGATADLKIEANVVSIQLK